MGEALDKLLTTRNPLAFSALASQPIPPTFWLKILEFDLVLIMTATWACLPSLADQNTTVFGG